MASHYYIKLYFEILNDIKMCRLPDRSWRRVIELFLVAGAHNWSSELPSVTDMAWVLRINPDELLKDLKAIEETGIIKEREPGKWIVTNFEKRQDAETGAERMKRYRSQKRIHTYLSDEFSDDASQESVTNSEPELRVKVKVKDREGAADPFFEMQATIERITGYPVTPTPENIKAINDLIAMKPTEEDFQDALAYLGGNGTVVRSPKSLVGSVRTAVAKRTQRQNSKPAEKPWIPEEHASEVY